MYGLNSYVAARAWPAPAAASRAVARTALRTAVRTDTTGSLSGGLRSGRGHSPGRRSRIAHGSLKARPYGAAMQTRRLGKTGFEVSEVGFGAWAIGGSWGETEDEV